MLRLRCIAAVAAVFAVVTAAPPARAALWKYVDERGTAHFVPERAQIPPRFRDKAYELGAAGKSGGGGISVSSATKAPVAAPQALQAAPEAPPQTLPPDHSGTDAQADINAIQQAHEPYVKQVEALNQINPLSAEGPSAAALGQLPPQLQFLGKVMNDPRAKRLATELANPVNQGYLKTMADNPDRKVTFYVMGAALLVVSYLRWKMRQSEMGFLATMFSKLLLTGLLVGCSVAITYYVYGEPLVGFLKNVWKAVI